MIALPRCRWRQEKEDGRHLCTSAKFVNAPNVVRAENCATCCYVDHDPPAPLPPALPCIHLEGLVAKDAGKKSKNTTARLFACALHGRCAVVGAGTKVPRAVHRCGGCPDYLARDPFGPSSVEMGRRADAFLAAIPDYPRRRFRGRGVVIAGGGDRFFASLYVTIRALRHVGCELPIQVWYLGRKDEMPADRQALLAPYQVECIDADRVRRRHPARKLDGWELKAFAALHSRFEEVLFLDADCYPCRNPEFLFDRPDYREQGAIFWPDLAPFDARLKWPAFGVADPQRPGSVESGQFVVNKRLCWQPLNLAWFYNDHSDYYYRYGYGDKHTFQVAWARCERSFVMWQPTALWQDVAYVHHGPDRLPLFVHRCADKFRSKSEAFATPQQHAGQAFHPRLPLERECWGWLGELALELGPRARRKRKRAVGPVPERIIRIGLPEHFNCSIFEYQGRCLLASRQGEFTGRIFLTELGPDFQPLATVPLDIEHPRALSGVEDPRLFSFRGRLHCAFTGVDDAGPARQTHQLVCRLGDDFRVEKVWLPQFAGRAQFEKNWQFFEHRGSLYSIYAVRPHIVLRHRRHQAELAAQTAAPLPWADHHLRGGAPPVRVGDEYYHFFHTMKESGGHPEYAVGLYTFAAQPPFAICRVAPGPILCPDQYDRPAGFDKSVAFPCGAMLHNGRWIISYGYHDSESRVAVFEADVIEGRLQRVEFN